MNCNEVGIVLIKWYDYRIHFWCMNKNDAIRIVNNSNLNERSGLLIFFIIYKNEWNREAVLNRAKEYYKNDKERLRQQGKNKYRELSEEEKNIKREHGRNRHHYMFEEKKQKLKEYKKNYCEVKKPQFSDQ